MGPDYRLLVKRARKMAQQYFLIYREPIPTAQLVQRVAMVMQEYTQSGYDHFKFQLFEIWGMVGRNRTEISSSKGEVKMMGRFRERERERERGGGGGGSTVLTCI
jgi:hypothetical protein